MTERMAKRAVVCGVRVLVPLLLLSPAFAAEDASTAASAAALTVLPASASAADPSPAPDTDVVAAPTVPASTDVPALDAPALPATPDLPVPVVDAPADTDLPTPDAIPGRPEPATAPPGDLASGPDPLDPESLQQLARRDVVALGPLSIGTPDAGLLVNPQPMPQGPLWTIRNPLETWGTQETIDFLAAAIEEVNARFPGSPPVVIGDISRPDGGRLNRHKSHQAGRDVDVGFYYSSGRAGDFQVARRGQIDLARSWALVRSLLTQTDVDRIFVDRTLIAQFYRYARDEEREDPAWLDDVFGRGERKGIIQHERRHKDHMHVRFFNRVAQEKGRIVYPVLVEAGVVGPPMVKHRVRRGETLGHLANRYGTSVSAIKAANGLRTSRLRAGRSYLVPVRKVRSDGLPIVVPPRRLPPPPPAQAAVRPEIFPAPPETVVPEALAPAPAPVGPAPAGGRN